MISSTQSWIKKKGLRYFAIILFSLICFQIVCQQDTTVIRETTEGKKNSFTSIFYGQPGKAALYSLVIPGTGQLYNKRYWKAPLVWAGEGFAVYYLTNRIKTFQNRNDCWKGLLNDATDPDLLCTPAKLGTSESITDIGAAFELRNSARSAKESAWIIMSAVHILNIVEAFVDRHLINFDTSEDLSFHNMPKLEIEKSTQFGFAKVNLITFRLSLN